MGLKTSGREERNGKEVNLSDFIYHLQFKAFGFLIIVKFCTNTNLDIYLILCIVVIYFDSIVY